MKKSSLLIVLGLLGTLSPASAADITGVITLKGTPPAERELSPIKDDAICSTLYSSTLPTTHFYVVGANGGLGDVVVLLKDVTGKSTGATAAPAVLDQKGCVYEPTILAVQTGQKIVVKNSDPCVHNVHVTPTANPELNQVQMQGAADLTFTFDKPEPFIRFKCDVHPWMFAWVTVVDSPYYALSDKDGKFTIKNVPPGKYVLEAAHRKLGSQTADIEVKDGATTQNFTFEIK
jgi:plastocyanin